MVLLMRQNGRASLEKVCRLKVLLMQFFPVALLVIFLLVYAKCKCFEMNINVLNDF